MGLMKHASVALLLITITVLCGGCAPAVDVTKGVQVAAVSTGWVNAGVVDGKHKVVPAVSFTLKNVSDRKLPALQVNAVFRRVNEPGEWDAGFRPVAGSEGFAPGATRPLSISANLGYTGLDPAERLLENSQFVDATVD